MRRAAAPRSAQLRTDIIELPRGRVGCFLRFVATERVVELMSQAISITPEMTRVIREGRLASQPRTWREISEELGISLKSAINVAKRVDLYQPSYGERIDRSPPAPSPAAVQPVAGDDLTQPSANDDLKQPFLDYALNRAPLPPGDPISWGAIIAGTCLEGVPYLRG